MAKRPIKPEDLLRMKFVGDTQLSPDGSQVLFSVREITSKNSYLSHLWTVDIATGDKKQWTRGKESAGQGRFSPNGELISFIAKRGEDNPQICLLPLAGGESYALTKFPEGDLGWHMWSPDGSHILAVFRARLQKRSKGAAKEREEKGLSTPPLEMDNIWHKLDGDGFFEDARFHLYLVDAKTGEHKLLYDKDPIGFMSCDWLPDSSGVLICHDQRDNPFFGMPDDAIWKLSLKGKTKKIKCGVKGSKGGVKASPSGRFVAYLGSDKPEGWGTQNTHLWVCDLESGETRCVTANHDYDYTVMTLSDTNAGHTSDGGGEGLVVWTPDEKAIYVSLGWRGSVHLAKVVVETGEISILTPGGQSVIAVAGTKDAKLFSAYVGNSVKLNEAAVIDGVTGEIRVLTHFNQWVDEELELSKPEELEIPTTDGLKVHAWVMKPADFRPKKKHPAVLEIHGGPHAQYGNAFFHEFQVLAAEGWFVVFSNPRGSKGYGEDWTKAIQSNWGVKDWEDIQAVTTWMKSNPNIDSSRMGVMGGSYGGYMTNWVIGHTNDFRAAITDRCVSNMVSFAGNSDFAMNDNSYFGGCAYSNLESIAPLWRQSPLAYFDKVKTPTLIIHSEGDLRCNIEQADQVFTALQAQGVESRYIRYPVNTSHGMSRGGPPDLRLHRLGEIVSWWKKHLD